MIAHSLFIERTAFTNLPFTPLKNFEFGMSFLPYPYLRIKQASQSLFQTTLSAGKQAIEEWETQKSSGSTPGGAGRTPS
ncbi:hypothetical protein Sjap_026667 [Stephania japonica]|uniref:Uncharacterized protein n=1 Tax=Stephania japonica TaxID=461633 RepID=A0AAP0DXR6_9MAGN